MSPQCYDHVLRPSDLVSRLSKPPFYIADIVSHRATSHYIAWHRNSHRWVHTPSFDLSTSSHNLGTVSSNSTTFIILLFQYLHRSISVNQELEIYLHFYVNDSHTDWASHLPLAEFAYNNKVHSTTKISPHFALFGLHPWKGNPLTINDAQNPAGADYGKRITDIRLKANSFLKAACESLLWSETWQVLAIQRRWSCVARKYKHHTLPRRNLPLNDTACSPSFPNMALLHSSLTSQPPGLAFTPSSTRHFFPRITNPPLTTKPWLMHRLHLSS
jgi:hypothetical protein